MNVIIIVASKQWNINFAVAAAAKIALAALHVHSNSQNVDGVSSLSDYHCSANPA